MAEKEIIRVVFTYENGAQRVLEGEELRKWEVICMMHSDYLLPGGPDHVLASMHGGIVQGFVPAQAITAKKQAPWK